MQQGTDTPPVTYSREGKSIVLVNPANVPLRLGDVTFRELQWSITSESFAQLQRENPHVVFVESKSA